MTLDRESFRRSEFARVRGPTLGRYRAAIDRIQALPIEDRDPERLAWLADMAYEDACTAWMLEPDGAVVPEALIVAAQADAAGMACWYADERFVEVMLGSRPIRIETGLEPKRGEPGRWMRAACIAAAARDARLIELLVACPVPSEPPPGVQWARWYVHEIAALRTLLQAKPAKEILRLVDRVRAAAAEDAIEPWSEKAARDFGLPETAVLECVVRKDQAGLDRALRDALERFQRHYAKDPLEIEGVLDIPLVGLSALAVDAGLAVSTFGDELPKELVDGARFGRG